MSVPTYDNFIEPILRYLADRPGGVPAREAHEAAAQVLNISEADRQERLPSGSQYVYKNRAGWAHDRLKRAGLSASPRRGFWQLTQEGQEYASSHSSPLSAEEIERLALGFIDVRLSKDPSVKNYIPTSAPIYTAAGAAIASPDDRLGEAVEEIKRTVAIELTEYLTSVSHEYFEVLVLDVLHRMGYGTNRADLQRIGGVGDGGVDGVISLDKLGLEKIYVQAKRWKSSVGRPEIQGFYGALAGRKANKGIFISTSYYTPPAIEFAESVERITLIDGVRLAELMIEYEVGVTSRTIKIPKIDTDYFDEESN